MKRVIFWGVIAPRLLKRVVPAWLLESPALVSARHPWIALGIAGAALAVGGLAVAASGVVPLKASAGHWPVTEWLLHFSMQQSIATHAALIEPPPLDDPALVRRGAGHYDLGCRPCHGSVGGDRPMIPRAMLPPPRVLTTRVPHWRTEELFYIVKHGVKFTGMPAWPVQQRDDEVWAVVAFLKRLPELDRDAYERWMRPERTARDNGPAEPPEVVAEVCARCHGIDGGGAGDAAFPKLAGQRVDYMERALRAYADGRRYSGIMGPIAANLSAASRRAVSAYYASLPAMEPEATGAHPSSRGRDIATRGVTAEKIPACVECHGPAATPKNPAYPILAGQHASFLAQQLELLQQRRRGGSEYVHVMHSFVDRLQPEQLRDVTRYYAGLSQ